MPRIIYTLAYTLERPLGPETLELHFRRDGMPRDFKEFDERKETGKPMPPKRRTIDLRVGDRMYDFPGWHRILKIVCVRDEWVEEVFGEEGFVMGA